MATVCLCIEMDLASTLPSSPCSFPNNKRNERHHHGYISRAVVINNLQIHAHAAALIHSSIQSIQPPISLKLTSAESHEGHRQHREPPLFHASSSNSITIYRYESLLEDCINIKQIHQLHARMLITGFLQKNTILLNELVNRYTLCGDMDYARLIFDRVHRPDVFLWNVMIRGYASIGLCAEALQLYHQMREKGIQPDKFTFPFVLKACAGLSALREGKEIQSQIIRFGFESDIFVQNSLVVMYARCGTIWVARKVFEKMLQRNVVSWSAMITGYAQSGHEHANEALLIFNEMQLQGIKPNVVTLVSIIPACAHISAEALHQGKPIHGYIIKSGFEYDVVVSTVLVDMYAKCGRVDIARQLFDTMCARNVVSWSAMITGYVLNGYASEALKLFGEMLLQRDIKPNSVTVVSVIPACAHLTALQRGKEIHGYIIRRSESFELDVVVGTALIDMYAKCGNIEIASRLFHRMPRRNIISWNTMIMGYAMHGQSEDALVLFIQMQKQQVMCIIPDRITFIGVLSACSHAGRVDEGWRYFDSMRRDYCIEPDVEHYACLVDMLGRAGHVEEAFDFIKKMPLEPNAAVWGALLGACRIHNNVVLGEHVAQQLFEIEPKNSGNHVLLSKLYAQAGRWDDVTRVTTLIKQKGLRKPPGCSWIEVNNRVHTFLVGDRLDPQSEEIYATLGTLAEHMKDAGYSPNADIVLHDVEEEVKQEMISSHSEKLAIAFGLINTGPGTPVRVMKNLRVCSDCHIATKLISKIAKREIILRDTYRFHHFKDGLCSCRDYW